MMTCMLHASCEKWRNMILGNVIISKLQTNMIPPLPEGGTAVAQWLRCCATNRKVAGSIPSGVIGHFH